MLIPPKNTVYKLAKGAENPSVDLVNTRVRALEKECTGQKSPASSGVNGHQVGDVKSTAAVGRTSTSVKARVWCRFETVLRVGFCRINNEETLAHKRELWHPLVGKQAMYGAAIEKAGVSYP